MIKRTHNLLIITPPQVSWRRGCRKAAECCVRIEKPILSRKRDWVGSLF